MLKNADSNSFAGIYIVCGYTDMRYGIDSLAAIIESKYHLPLFVPGTLFLFSGRRANKIKGLVWERDGFLLLTVLLPLIERTGSMFTPKVELPPVPFFTVLSKQQGPIIFESTIIWIMSSPNW